MSVQYRVMNYFEKHRESVKLGPRKATGGIGERKIHTDR